MADGGRAQIADRANWNNPGARQDYMNDRVANRQDRAAGLEDRMQGRQENRQANREGRQDNREDFRDNFWDNAHDMAHDHWHDDFGDYWDHMWEHHPVGAALGVTAWGVNRLSYWFGYGGGYSNPYYSDGGGGGGGGYADYSQPLETYEQVSAPAETTAQATPPADSASQTPASQTPASPVNDHFNAAQNAFYSGDYAGAFKSVNDALALAKNDSVMHEFRALVLFAQGKYQDAAATIHSVLAVGPGWDWTTMISLYPSVEVYTQQLRMLEEAVKASPNDAALHFLLAYHYITTSATEPAIQQLQDVVRLQPKDTVAVQLIQMIGGQQALPPQLQQTSPPPSVPSAVALQASDLVGQWKSNSGDSRFELKLTDKNTFSWIYENKGKTTTVEGVYAVQGNTLAMEPDAGGTMAAELTKLTGTGFHFAVVGAPPGDKGLDFKKG